jgi:hypothetical protein
MEWVRLEAIDHFTQLQRFFEHVILNQAIQAQPAVGAGRLSADVCSEILAVLFGKVSEDHSQAIGQAQDVVISLRTDVDRTDEAHIRWGRSLRSLGQFCQAPRAKPRLPLTHQPAVRAKASVHQAR